MTTPTKPKDPDYGAFALAAMVAIVLGNLFELGALLIALVTIGLYLLFRKLRKPRAPLHEVSREGH